MKHFRRIACDIDTSSIRAHLDEHPGLWDGRMWRDETPVMDGVKPRLMSNSVNADGTADTSFRAAMRSGARETLFLRWMTPEIAAMDFTFECHVEPAGRSLPRRLDCTRRCKTIARSLGRVSGRPLP